MAEKRGRDAQIISFTGETGTGKSYKGKEIAKIISRGVLSQLSEKELPTKGGKVLVISYTGSGDSWIECKETSPTAKGLSFKRGWRMIRVNKWQKNKNDLAFLEEIFKHFENGLIIFDDCKQYLDGNWNNSKGLQDMLNEHRHRGLDMFFIAHSPNHIPRQVWAYISKSFLFACKMALKTAEIASTSGQDIVKAQSIVNRRFKIESYKQGKKARGVYEYLVL